MTHVLRYAARTDVGLVRQNNQDSVFAGDRLLIVADGMGGHAAGDKASRIAVNTFMPLNDRVPGKDLLGPLDDATHDSNQAIAELVARDPELEGMGTTVTALLFDGNRLGIAHVGDSRAYLWRDGMLSQITHDDTFVQSLIDEGRITEAEASHHPQRSLILRAVNGTDTEPTLQQRVSQVGDRYLICSDGLSGVVAPEDIADTLASFEVDPAADRLIDLALRGGAPDNVTVIVADVLETGVTPGHVMIEEIDPDADLDATGPILPIHVTQRMPRIPLPAETTDASQLETTPIRRPLNQDEVDDDDSDEDLIHTAPERKWRRRSALTLALVVLLGILGTGSFLWIRSQYYVGEDDGRVVIYRGVDGSILGLKLASATEDSCQGAAECVPLRTTDLVAGARAQVFGGIPAGGLEDARAVIERLAANELLPPCRVVPVEETPTTSPAPSTEPSLTTIVTTSAVSSVPGSVPNPAPTDNQTTSPPKSTTDKTTGSDKTTGAEKTTGTDKTTATVGTTSRRPAGNDTFARVVTPTGTNPAGAAKTNEKTTENSTNTEQKNNREQASTDPDAGNANSQGSADTDAAVTTVTVVSALTPTEPPVPTATGTLTPPALIPGETCRVVGG